jgi:hypothetical protein
MRTKNKQFDNAPGQDAFLDVVANLVGILIILIMVIGAQATDAMVDAEPDEAEAEPQAAPVDPEAARAAASALESDIHAIDAKLKRQQLEIAYRRSERDKMLQVVMGVEQQFEQQRAALDEHQRQDLQATRELLAAQADLEDLKARRTALENSRPAPNVIEHLPTPLAKTVFGTELHFRLLQGRVAYIPWNELVAMLKEDAPKSVGKLRDATQVTETLGPIGGFRMQYTLRRVQQLAPAAGGMAVQQRVELDRFTLVPTRDDLGESLPQAMSEGSEFRDLLKRLDPDRTTVTVWVYPDSFDQFRTLKAELFRRGFSTAGRPLPEGHPIGGSPDGSRSVSQ